MPKKIIELKDLGEVGFYKHHNANTIKIRINGSEVKVTLPTWVPYRVASDYVQKRSTWILANRKPIYFIKDGDTVGRGLKLSLLKSNSSRILTKLTSDKLIIKLPSHLNLNSPEIQTKINRQIKKAVQSQAYDLLLPYVRKVAKQANFEVGSIEVKDLKSRWGSCTSKNDLAFSLYLIQLPWHCVNYVVVHELAHTIHHNHSLNFWKLVARYEPNYKAIRLEMKHYSPQLMSQNTSIV